MRTLLKYVRLGLPIAVFIPLAFWLQFGELNAYAWGLTVFLLTFGFSVELLVHLPSDYVSPVAAKNDVFDKIGVTWIMFCGLGPFFGWICTELPTLSTSSWRSYYWARVILAGILPVLTALPLTRYARGRVTWGVLGFLACITVLSALSTVNTARDLYQGPNGSRLMHTEKVIH